MKKEIRGAEAIRYAEMQGIIFDDDEAFLLRAEGERLGRPATPNDLDDLFEENLDRCYDRTDLEPGGESFNFLVKRYGDGWIYVALGGHHPEQEERAVLRLLRSPLREKEPYCGGDILDLASEYGPRLRNTGFPNDANMNLLFHAALRLAGRGELKVVEDDRLPANSEPGSYGRRQFFIKHDVRVPLGNALCDMCRMEYGTSRLSLHYECAARLQKALLKVLPRSTPK
jgi:hypothetical protein